MDKSNRRDFIKYGLATIGGFIASTVLIKIDQGTGFKVGAHNLDVGMSEANAACGASYNCSGGGGQCGASYNCSGGGGQCGASYNCSGGGGKCGASYNCSGT